MEKLKNFEYANTNQKFCLIGERLPHTLSPTIHQMMGLDYQAVELPDERAVVDFVKAGNFCGYNVTIPYKQTIISLIDEVDTVAAACGAVNTVVFDGKKTKGYNTDISGMIFALKSANIELCGKKVLILGGGGTSHTAQFVAKMSNAAKITVVSRSGEVNYQSCYQLTDTQIIINTTPIGMYPSCDVSPIDVACFAKLEGVFDVIYNPFCTKLIAEAKKLGIKAENGFLMFVAQAKYARDLFVKQKVDDKFIKIIANDMLYKLKNIILVGMPSCGKTTLGQKISKRLGREFVDTDSKIVQSSGKTVQQIFAEVGESGFRELEIAVVKEVSSHFGQVIATGGGAVLAEQNCEALHQNGIVFFITRPLESLSTDGRPLSKDFETLQKMWQIRQPLYKNVADFEVCNDNNIDKCIEEIISKYENTCNQWG